MARNGTNKRQKAKGKKAKSAAKSNVLYHTRVMPTRKAHRSNQYASVSIVDVVDDILKGPTTDELLLKARKERAHQTKNDDVDEESERNSSESGEDNDYEESEDEKPTEQTKTPRKSPSQRGKKDKTDEILSVSSNSSDMQSQKEKRRVHDADDRRSSSGGQKVIENYKKTVATLRESTKEKDQEIKEKDEEIDELKDELHDLKRKFGLLENENAKARAALLHIRNNPEELVREAAMKGPTRKYSKTKASMLRSLTVDGVKGKGTLLTTGKETVKNIVYRTFKFINNNTQETMFCNLVMNNLGLEELLFQASDTEERKAEVEKKRKEICEEYGPIWVSELNSHRTYVQVSA